MTNRILKKLTTTGVLILCMWSSFSCLAANIVRGPYIQLGTESSMIIRWNTDKPTNSQVKYGASPNALINSKQQSELTTNHEVSLTGLTALTRYYYSVGSTSEVLAGNDTETFFETSPAIGQATPTRFWILGDPGRAGTNPDSDEQKIVRDGYYQFANGAYTDFWLMLGDNAYNDGTIEEYQNAVFNQYPKLLKQSPLWPVMGNHDNRTAKVETGTGGYYDLFTLPKSGEAGGVASGHEAYFSFDYGNIHIVVLNSSDKEHFDVSGPMDDWLKKDLAKTQAEWLIAVFHHPVYGKSGHDSDTEINMIKMREVFAPILEAHGVDLVMTGHNHFYTRSTLMSGHYGDSDSYDASKHNLNSGDGRTDGDGAYLKNGRSANSGTVYITHGAGAGGGDGYARLVRADEIDTKKRHPADYMYGGRGSMVIDVNGKTLDVTVIGPTGKTVDYFTIKHTDANQENQPPSAVANGPYSGSIGQAVLFSSDGSADSDGTIKSYQWDFGDGSQSAEANPTYTYQSAGEYTATLTVVDDKDASDRAETQVSITGSSSNELANNVPRKVNGVKDEEINFTFKVPPESSSLKVNIDGGEGDADLYVRFGQPVTVNEFDCRPYKNGNKESCEISPSQSGTYHIMLRGYRNFSEVKLTASYQVSANESPSADANGPYSGLVDAEIALSSDGSFDPDGSVSSYHWDFGDGNQSSQKNPTHRYALPGTYTATLTITDEQGATSKDSAEVVVTQTDDTISDACAEGKTPISGGRIDIGIAYCLESTTDSDQIQMAHYVKDDGVGKTLEILVRYGTGNADLLHRYGSRPNASTWDYRSANANNSETILVPAAKKGWNYIHVRANPEFSGAVIYLQLIEN
ncbi:PKD domain-containing protein [Aliikangiella coralliicola]|uniref:PKD domain-containing protein n=1 Tax=Aliikangiella coralliicola TaxID=2592383 RepID=UPI00143D530D|nr:PKD domain-containing protein [Aliikangiella coralliicola]